MIEADVEVRKWGDSMALIIPKRLADKENIQVNDVVHLRVEKSADLSDVFGMLKGRLRMSPQEFKDEARKDWK